LNFCAFGSLRSAGCASAVDGPVVSATGAPASRCSSRSNWAAPSANTCRSFREGEALPGHARSADEAAALLGQKVAVAAQVQPADAEKVRLLMESARIRLAYAHDRQFAVSLSGIRTLPHQIEAVYLKMLPQPRLRFLLADDPGAGKTIMAGLLLKEMKLRQAIDPGLFT
jgi:hypothetical protein